MKIDNTAKVWDLPTRLFHWLIVLFVIISWITAENRLMDWHFYSGLCVFGLLVFRFLWGFWGSSTSRFSDFVRSPLAVIEYVRSRGPQVPTPGHGPLGGYSVLALLLLLTVQVGTGLISVDIDGIDSGPLSYLVTYDQGRSAAQIHEFSFNELIGLIALHLTAIIYYRLRYGRKLTGPMLSGQDPQIPVETPPMKSAPLRVLALCAAVAIGTAWWIGFGL